MEHLHAPWRIDYILSPKEPQGEESLFTRIAQSSDDVANLVVHRDKTCFVVMNRYPYNGGHLMVVPYKQAAELDELDIDVENSIVLAEWASPFASALADSWVEIVLERPVGNSDSLNDDEPRAATLAAHGHGGELAQRLRAVSEVFDVSRD